MLRTHYTLSKNKSIGVTGTTIHLYDTENDVTIKLDKKESLMLVKSLCDYIGRPIGSLNTESTRLTGNEGSGSGKDR